MPPLAMRYQDDPNVRNRGQEKLIGRELLTAVTAGQNIDRGDVYLPAGTWIDWYSNERVTSPGMLRPVPLYRDGLFRLPLFARAGALIPMAVVDEQTMCSQGRRKDGSRRDDLVVKVFDFGPEVGQQRSFTLYEDDGRTIAYQQGAVRTTGLTNTVLAPESGSEETHRVQVEIAPAQGTYAGAPDSRVNLVRLVTDGNALGASLNGQPLAAQTNLAAFDAAPSGWIGLGNGEVLAKSAPMAVADAKTFVIQIGEPTCTSTNQYVAVPGAGNGWNPADPDRRLTSCEGRVWSGEITLCNEEHKFAANGGWAVNWGCDGKQDGANCPPREPGIYRVSFDETAPASSVFERIGEAAACAGGSSLFVCENGDTSWGTSVYVVGNRERLGNWDPKHAQILVADGPYPKWTGYIDDLPADGDIEWKCIKRLEGADRRVIQWEPGPNNRFDPASAAQIGDFHGN
jgi:alpha-glucosidase